MNTLGHFTGSHRNFILLHESAHLLVDIDTLSGKLQHLRALVYSELLTSRLDLQQRYIELPMISPR